jgi:hypothetical protein
MTQMLKVDEAFTPCPIHDGDELFPNGIFEFNVTKILEHIEKNPADVDLTEIEVSELCPQFSSIDESYVEPADISRPVVLVEVSPGHYNLIDGHHRMEKARRSGVGRIRAYKLKVLQHVAFLTSKKAYLCYVEYWNNKVKQLRP